MFGITFGLTSDSSQMKVTESEVALTTRQFAAPYPMPTKALDIGGDMWVLSGGSASASNYGYSSPQQAAYSQYKGTDITINHCEGPPFRGNENQAGCFIKYPGTGEIMLAAQVNRITSPVKCNTVTSYTDGTNCSDETPQYGPQTYVTTNFPIESPSLNTDIAAAINPEERAKPITPDSIVDLSNKLYNELSQTSPNPFPRYDPANPVTAQDVPKVVTTVADTLQPQSPQDYATSPYGAPVTTDPATPTNPSPEVGTVTDPKDPEHQEPVIGAPGMEPIPTIDKILGPFFSIMPSLQNFKIPDHQTACPIFSVKFELYGKRFGGDYSYHCDLAQQFRSEIRAAAIVFYTISIVFIFLI